MMKNKAREVFLCTSLLFFSDDVNDSPFDLEEGAYMMHTWMVLNLSLAGNLVDMVIS
jgi:hypothetical protein